MKTLVIVSTEYQQGKGGIQSALQGYCDGFDELQIDYIIVTSHKEGGYFQHHWLMALYQVIKLSVKYKNNGAVFWFHCGPWLSLFRKALLAAIPRLTGLTTIGHIHSYSMKKYLSSSLGRFYVKLMFLPYSELMVLTPWWKTFLQQNKVTQKINISENPVRQSMCEAASVSLSHPVSDQTSVPIALLTMGRLIPGKGFEQLIQSMNLLPEYYQLTIVGDGPLRLELERLCVKLSLTSRINFTGWLEGEKKDECLRAATIFCLISENDAFGMSFIEAMAYDLPIVALDFEPVKDIITSDVAIFSSKQAPLEIKVAIDAMTSKLVDFKGKGPQRVLNKYSPSKSAKNIIQYLH